MYTVLQPGGAGRKSKAVQTRPAVCSEILAATEYGLDYLGCVDIGEPGDRGRAVSRMDVQKLGSLLGNGEVKDNSL
jgi:hypothetical protein